MPKVGLVADSTCDVAPEWFAEHDVVLVPLNIIFGKETYLDRVGLKPDEFYEKLVAAPELPTTSQPSPAAFAEAYKGLADAGCEEIVSIHLTGALSGTVESALIAAKDAPVKVRVVDTKLVSQAYALSVFAAVESRDRGDSAATVEAVASSTAENTRLLFVLDTLDYLVKGGRAGKAQGLAASLLSIKPILEMNKAGIIEPYKKVRGESQAMAALVQTVADDAKRLGHLKVAILHAIRPVKAEQLAADLRATGADIEIVSTGLVGAVVGTYAGPGAVGVAYHPA